MKIKSEQDMKNKYKKLSSSLEEEKSSLLYALHSEAIDNDVILTQRVGKCTMFSDKVRQLFMTLQGETNLAAAHVSKVVMLVSKFLFNKDIPLSELPCPRTCLNFMQEAHHIAKQQVVEEISQSEHFTYCTDGTSRQKLHYMEHHAVLDNGSTLSIGFTEVPDDKSNTLLEKSIDLLDELSDVHCQANEGTDKNDVFKTILVKMKSLMSDRAANMKLFNQKMLEHKKELLGDDASIHFLYCNAHFLIGLADSTEKAIQACEEGLKLGRDNEPMFKNWNSDEASAFRLLRTAADVLGPRGDEKSGCREEWLAHCDIKKVKSQFSSYRSNRFNNIFENAVALLFHYEDCFSFISDWVSHTNRKLQSICFDLRDATIMSIINAIALFSTYLTTPYWALMNSSVPYGHFPRYVRSMEAALDRWSSDDFELQELLLEKPIFDCSFSSNSGVAMSFLQSEYCDESMVATVFKRIAKQCKQVLARQLSDFLSGGIYGGDIPAEIQSLLDTCPLTNLTGERLFGDLDYDMSKRRTATTHLRSTINMWKHNKPSKFLSKKAPSVLKKIMDSGRKHGKALKKKSMMRMSN